MSILREHFDRLKDAGAQGLPVISGLFMDVGGTLIRTGTINQPLVEFAKWNAEHGLLGPNTVFSKDLRDAHGMIAQAGLTLAELGVQKLAPTQATYNAAFSAQHTDNMALLHAAASKADFKARPSHRMSLVIDDSKPYKEGIQGCGLVLTWWNPDDKAVQAFLKNREYVNFSL